MTLDPSAVAATRAAIAAAGTWVRVSRLTGAPPGAIARTANVMAKILSATQARTDVAATGYSASQVGALTQDERKLILMAADLAAAGFPMPLRKGDRVKTALNGETFEVTRVDPFKRAIAGALEATLTGVA